MKFCPECSALLELDPTENILKYICKSCAYSVEETNPIIYRHDFNVNNINFNLIKNAKYNSTILKDKLFCSHCNKDNIVSILREKDTLKRIFICSVCDTYW